MTDSTFTFRVDDELKAAFADIASAQEHTAAQLLRMLMRNTVQEWRESQEHDAWFRGEVNHALREAADPDVERIPHDRVLSSWRQQRAELEQRPARRVT
jgi:predicted transcriptional regulator